MNDRYMFRAWHKERKQMYGVTLLHWHNGKIKDVLCAVEKSASDYDFPADEIELMQCTGLKDKTGRLIYEGDIVKINEFHDAYTHGLSPYVHFIKYDNGCCSFMGFRKIGSEYAEYLDYTTDIKIIGNIFDNPELLEVSE